MSLFRETIITCPNCEEPIHFDEADSVNADRRPDLREAIIDNTFQTLLCPSCSEDVRMAPQFNYLDIENGLWLAAFPGAMMPDYIELEETIADVFDEAYGSRSTAAARLVGDDLDVRMTFGWQALREKIVLRNAGLDDVIVEMLKLDLMRRLPQAELGLGIELRVVNVTEEALDFAFILTDSEEVQEEFSAQRALYDAIVDNVEAWDTIRQRLTISPYVDIQQFYIGDGREAAQ